MAWQEVPQGFWRLMELCCERLPGNRPSFGQLEKYLQRLKDGRQEDRRDRHTRCYDYIACICDMYIYIYVYAYVVIVM